MTHHLRDPEALGASYRAADAATALLPHIDAVLADYFRHHDGCPCRICSLRRQMQALIAANNGSVVPSD